MVSIVNARCPKRDTHGIREWANTKHPKTESNCIDLLSTGRHDGAAMTAKFEHLDETKDLTAPAEGLVRLIRLIRTSSNSRTSRRSSPFWPGMGYYSLDFAN